MALSGGVRQHEPATSRAVVGPLHRLPPADDAFVHVDQLERPPGSTRLLLGRAPPGPVLELEELPVERPAPAVGGELPEGEGELLGRQLVLHLVEELGAHYELRTLHGDEVVEAEVEGVRTTPLVQDDAGPVASERVDGPVVRPPQGRAALDPIVVADQLAAAVAVDPIGRDIPLADAASHGGGASPSRVGGRMVRAVNIVVVYGARGGTGPDVGNDICGIHRGSNKG